jgi:glycosyltransferase involved in cell wall biosynthesis
MNIGLVIISKPGGGSETVVYNLYRYLSKKGHKVTLIANEEFFKWDPPIICDKINLKHLLDTEFICKSIFGKNLIPKIFLKKNDFFNPYLIDIYLRKEIKNILNDINDKKIDILHFHDPIYSLKLYKHLSKISNIPSIYTFHGNDIALPFYKRGMKKKFIKTINHINLITTVSNYMKNYLIENGIRSDINVIYNGIDFDQIKNIIKKNNKVNHKKTFKLIFAGGQKKNKGGKILLEAFRIAIKQKNNIKLYYCGSVSNDFITKHNYKNVIFTGLLSHKKYLQLLSKSDCLILLSKTEAFPIAILEAMSLGKTILTTPVGGIPEFFNSGINGFFVEQDPQKVSEKIIFLINNQNIRINISENNIKYAKKFQWNSIANQYIKAYKKNN